MRSLGKKTVLTEAFHKVTGESVIAVNNEVTVYQRADGSHFVRAWDGLSSKSRLDVTVQPDSSFYLPVGGPGWE